MSLLRKIEGLRHDRVRQFKPPPTHVYMDWRTWIDFTRSTEARYAMIWGNQVQPIELLGLKVCVPPNCNTDSDSPRFIEIL